MAVTCQWPKSQEDSILSDIDKNNFTPRATQSVPDINVLEGNFQKALSCFRKRFASNWPLPCQMDLGIFGLRWLHL